MKITDKVASFARPVVEQLGCKLWDVEFVREAGQWYLRLYIDKDGGVNITDCEAVSRALDPVLDAEDPIPESYTFEVSSAGLERQLKRPSDFEQFMGADVLVKLYTPVEGAKEFPGKLTRYNAGDVTITVQEKEYTFTKSQVALVRLRVDF